MKTTSVLRRLSLLSSEIFSRIFLGHVFSLIVKVLAGVFVIKILAINKNATENIVLYSQLQNIIGILLIILGSSFTTGIIRETSYSKRESYNFLNAPLNWALFITILLVAFLIAINALGLNEILNKVLPISKFMVLEEQIIIVIVAFFLAYFALYISYMTGLYELKLVYSFTALSSVITIFFAYFFISYYGAFGAICSLGVGGMVIVVLSYYKYPVTILSIRTIYETIKKLYPYAIVTTMSGAMFILRSIVIREEFLLKFDSNVAGLWEAMSRITNYHVLFFTSAISVLYLPKLVIRNNNFSEVNSKFKEMMLLLIIGPLISCFTILFFSNGLVLTLLSNQFIAIVKILPYMVIGDFAFILATGFRLFLLAQANHKVSFILELFFVLLFIISFKFILSKYGLEGAGLAYIFASLSYLLVHIFYWSYLYREKNVVNN